MWEEVRRLTVVGWRSETYQELTPSLSTTTTLLYLAIHHTNSLSASNQQCKPQTASVHYRVPCLQNPKQPTPNCHMTRSSTSLVSEAGCTGLFKAASSSLQSIHCYRICSCTVEASLHPANAKDLYPQATCILSTYIHHASANQSYGKNRGY
jgi:hypothetical protein